MHLEFRSVLRWLIRPRYTVTLLFFLLQKITQRGLNYFGNPHELPPNFSELIEKINRKSEIVSEVDNAKVKPRVVKLATSNFRIGEEFWLQELLDPEDQEALHRFNWLLTEVSTPNSDLTFTLGLNFVRNWATKPEVQRKPEAWEAYTVSERITNICLFTFVKTKKTLLPEDIAFLIDTWARYLSNNLEFKGEELTCNHLFNNGRALFFAGFFLKNSDYTELARNIFEQTLPKLITKEGFFSEGSSHYHLLFTRWLLEIGFFAKSSGNQILMNLVNPACEKLLNRVKFFCVVDREGQIRLPLIGDVSPDFRPNWLISLFHCGLWHGELCCDHKVADFQTKSAWYRLLSKHKGVSRNNNKNAFQPAKLIFKESGWYRFSFASWTVLFRASSTSSKRQAGHFHDDLASFVLFFEGLPILVDLGRKSYDNTDQTSLKQIRGSEHNSLSINGRPASLRPNFTALPKFYTHCEVAVDAEIKHNVMKIKIVHDGFSRLKIGVSTHERTIELGVKTAKVIDRLDTKSTILVKRRFNFSPTLNLARHSDHTFKVMSSSGSVSKIDMYLESKTKILENEKNQIISVDYTENYGQTNGTQALEFLNQIQKNQEATLLFKVL